MLALYQLLAFFNSLSPQDNYYSIIQVILKNIYQLPNLSLEKLAQLCFVSPTTINHLTKKLGYNGYSDFKNNLKTGIIDYSFGFFNMSNDGGNCMSNPDEAVNNLYTALLETEKNNPKELFDQICNVMHEKRKVSFYADVRDCIISRNARFLQLHMLMAQKETGFFWKPEDQLNDLNTLNKDCLVIVPCSKYIHAHKHCISLILGAKKQGATVICIAETNDQVIQQADFVLKTTAQENGIDCIIVDWLLLQLATHYSTVFPPSDHSY